MDEDIKGTPFKTVLQHGTKQPPFVYGCPTSCKSMIVSCGPNFTNVLIWVSSAAPEKASPFGWIHGCSWMFRCQLRSGGPLPSFSWCASCSYARHRSGHDDNEIIHALYLSPHLQGQSGMWWSVITGGQQLDCCCISRCTGCQFSLAPNLKCCF